MTQTPTRKGDEEQEMTVELKACPRCGNVAFVTLDNQVWCRTDRCLRLPPRETEAEVVAAWNERAAPAVPQDMAWLITWLNSQIESAAMKPAHREIYRCIVAALSQQPSPVAVGERCDVETNETGCLHPEVHKGSCGYSTPSEGEDDVARELLDEAYRASGYNEDGVRFARHTSADRAALAAVRTALARAGQGYGRGVRWQPIETHSGHCSPVLVCRDTPTETNRATSAFLDATGVWRVLNSESGMCPLPFVPTHWMRQPDQPSLAAPLDGEG